MQGNLAALLNSSEQFVPAEKVVDNMGRDNRACSTCSSSTSGLYNVINYACRILDDQFVHDRLRTTSGQTP